MKQIKAMALEQYRTPQILHMQKTQLLQTVMIHANTCWCNKWLSTGRDTDRMYQHNLDRKTKKPIG